jgi:hypothetical protein
MMGLYLGPESETMALSEENPKGFWERKDFMQLNDRILESSDASWLVTSHLGTQQGFTLDKKLEKDASQFILGLEAHRPWFLKDPRLCLTLPVWKDLVSHPAALVVFRNPLEVATSLQKRDGIPIPFGLDLWEHYMRMALQHSHEMPRLLVSYQALLEDLEGCTAQIQSFLKTHGFDPMRKPDLKEYEKFVDPGLNRSSMTPDAIEHSAISLYERLIKQDALENVNCSEQICQSLAVWENIIEKGVGYYRLSRTLGIKPNLTKGLKDLRQEIHNLHLKIAEQETLIEKLKDRLADNKIEELHLRLKAMETALKAGKNRRNLLLRKFFK